MDESTFDDMLREKLKDYHDPSFDPEALNDLHNRMQGQKFESMYSNRALQMAVAALLLLMGTNVYFILSNQELKKQLITENNQQRKFNHSFHAIDSLNKVISQLQCESETKPVVIVKSEARTIKTPDFRMKLVTVTDYKTDSTKETTSMKLGIGRIKDIPKEVFQQLVERDLLFENDGEAYLSLADRNHPIVTTSVHSKNKDLIIPQSEPGLFRLVSLNSKQEEEKVVGPPITRHGEKSLAARNALEKHYYKGIGIQIAPHVDLMKGVFDRGQGKITPRYGITADWIMSPRISVESGVDYSTTETEMSSAEIDFTPVYSPNGKLESSIVTNTLLSSPISFKYRQWVFDKSQLVWRTTFTPYWSMMHASKNFFDVPDSNPDHDFDKVVTVDEKNKFGYYGSTIGTSIGLTLKREKNKGTWEASLFYEHNIGNMTDQNQMQLIGLRTAYWFKVK